MSSSSPLLESQPGGGPGRAKKVGRYALVGGAVYTVLTVVTFGTVFATITALDITPAQIGKLVYELKNRIPFLESTREEHAAESAAPEEPNWISRQLSQLDPAVKWVVTQSLLAMAITKFFSPLKVRVSYKNN